jgi:hypothetical protein
MVLSLILYRNYFFLIDGRIINNLIAELTLDSIKGISEGLINWCLLTMNKNIDFINNGKSIEHIFVIV